MNVVNAASIGAPAERSTEAHCRGKGPNVAGPFPRDTLLNHQLLAPALASGGKIQVPWLD
jgi:hypothetical protein